MVVVISYQVDSAWSNEDITSAVYTEGRLAPEGVNVDIQRLHFVREED